MTTFKSLAFGAGLMQVSILGEKDVTIRRYREEAHSFKKGEIVIGKFQDGLEILISMKEDTLTKPFRDITDEEAQGSGYANAQDALEGLKDFYADLQPDDTAAIIRYEILKLQGVPVVQFPEEE